MDDFCSNLWSEAGGNTLLVLGIFILFISLVTRIPPLRKLIQYWNFIRWLVVIILGLIVGGSILVIHTRIASTTTMDKPPHGITIYLWDIFREDGFGLLESGMVFVDLKTGAELDIDSDNALTYISNERNIRYLLPPSLRHHCYTNNPLGCRWADIDVANYEDKAEWIEYLSRVCIGLMSGAIVSFITWLQT